MSERLSRVETHCFSQDGRHILLDVQQNRFFAISPLERDILAAPQGLRLETLRQGLRQTYDDVNISHAVDRLQQLGILVTRPVPRAKADAWTAPAITQLELNVAQDCNLRCRYCIVEQGSFGAQRQQMSRVVARQAVDFLLRESGRASHCGLVLVGGEPMLNFAVIKDAVIYSQEQAARYGKQMTYQLLTNGTLFNEENLSFIKDHQIGVQVSLDGPPSVHDRLRHTAFGRGSHAVISSGLPRLLADYASQVSLRATLTRHSLPASELLDYLSAFGVRHVRLRYVLGDSEDYGLDPTAREQLKAEYTKLARRFVAAAPAGDLSAASFFTHYMAFFCTGRKRRPYCGAGVGILGVSASGGLYACSDLAERDPYRLGHVATGLDAQKLARWRSYLDVDNKPTCHHCWARYICGGGCLSSAIKHGGSPLDPIEAECELLRHLIQLAIWVHLELREKHPQVFLSLFSVPSFGRFSSESPTHGLVVQ